MDFAKDLNHLKVTVIDFKKGKTRQRQFIKWSATSIPLNKCGNVFCPTKVASPSQGYPQH